MRLYSLVRGVALFTLVAPVVGCATAGDPAAPIALQPDVPAWVETGALVQVGELGFIVPAEGDTVYAEAVRLDGSMVVAGITRDDDGIVTAVLEDHPPISGEVVSYACTNATECNDTARNPWQGKWSSTYSWKLNEATLPAGYTALVVRDDITKSADNWKSGRNSCGIADEAGGPNHAYGGATTKKPNISAAAACGPKDGESVIAFGPLDSYLGYACVWWNNTLWWHNMTEADILIDSTTTFFTGATVPTSCSGKYGLRNLMTHEMGHAFGFGHVDECGHGELTMSPNMGSCTNSNETLGRGDMLGVNDKY
jgi:hypothetical protein